MKGIGERKLVRLLSALMALALLLTAVPASAQMITDWENVSVGIVWMDDGGNTYEAMAWPVPEDYVQHGYWVTLPAEALGKTLFLRISHPDSGYFFHFNNWSTDAQWLMEDNAQDLSDEYAMYIGYSYNGVEQANQIPDFIKLYVSTMQYPFVEAGDMGPEILLPPEPGLIVTERPAVDVFQPMVTEPPVVEAIRPAATERPVVEAIRPAATERPVVEAIRPAATERPVQPATITVRYLDDRGKEIAPDQTAVLPGVDGTHPVVIDWSVVPAGYTSFQGIDSVDVIVRNGKAIQASVSFYFAKPVQTAVPVRTFDVTVYYYDSAGEREVAPRETKRLQPGIHRIEASASVLANGFELVGDPAFDLTVYEDGTYDRDAKDVAFWYRPAVVQPSTVKVAVHYVNESGQEIAPSHEMELATGRTHTIHPDVLRVPTGYDAASADAVQVAVSAEGHASPPVVSFVFGLRREEQAAPAGEPIGRYGITNAKVRFRTEPYATNKQTIIKEVPLGSAVYMLANEYNTKGELWTNVIIGNQMGYMQTMYIDMLTVEASDLHANAIGATPVPTFTPAPTPTPMPTEVFTEYITPVPVTPTPAVSYAVANWDTGIRTGTGSDERFLDWLEQEELVTVSGQIYDEQTQNIWCYVRTLDGVVGYVQQNALRTVTQWEADWYRRQWEQQHAAPAPTELITNTPAPEQWQGYAYALIDNVLLRQMASESAYVVDRLSVGEVVYVASQQYANAAQWHYVNHENHWGYIRSDFLREMTDEQAEVYFTQRYATPTPTQRPTAEPVLQNPMSGYGYVKGDAVNLRAAASTSSKALKSLNRYALCMVLDAVTAGGQKWYHVSFARTEGYIRSDLFVEMTVEEFNEFLAGDRYQQGLRNNGLLQDADNVGVPGSGGLVSGEDELLDNLYQSGAELLPMFSPYIPPVGTPKPLPTPTGTPTRKPGTGYVGSYLPVETPVVTGGTGLGESSSDLPLPGQSAGSIVPPQANAGAGQENGSNGGSSQIVAIVVIGLLIVTGIGVAAVVQHQRKRRRIAMRAAQRRAQQARSGGAMQQTGRMNRTGMYFQQPPAPYGQRVPSQTVSGQTGQLPVYPVQGQNTPMAPMQRPYARQTGTTPSAGVPVQQHVGRRTAYQQALAEQQNKNNPE